MTTPPARYPDDRPAALLLAAAVPTVADLRGRCTATVAFTAMGDPREADVPAIRCLSHLEGMTRVLAPSRRPAWPGEVVGGPPAADVPGAAPVDIVRALLAWAGRHPEAAGEHDSAAGFAIVEASPRAARTAT